MNPPPTPLNLQVKPFGVAAADTRAARSTTADAKVGGDLKYGVTPALTLDGTVHTDFSHVEVIFHFHRVAESAIERGTRHARGNVAWPRVGIFAQRGKNRPNRLGSTIAEIKGREGRVLTVAGLDAVDGTPVLDIKPLIVEFLPCGPVRQPPWSRELMRDYW